MDNIKEKFRKRDRLVRAISKDGKFRVAFIKNSNLAQTAQQRHQLAPIPASFLAQLLASSSLLVSFLKGEERVAITVEAEGKIRKIFAEAIQVGEVRGYVDIDETSTKDWQRTLGKGLLRVERILYGQFKPVTGVVELGHGDVTTDLCRYLDMSEQMPSALRIDVDTATSGQIQSSIALLVQILPGAHPEELRPVDAHMQSRGKLSAIMEESTPQQFLEHVLPFSAQITDSTPVDFFCRCSLANFKQKLLTLGIEELKDMQLQGHNELNCQFCNENYVLTASDFQSMIAELAKRSQ